MAGKKSSPKDASKFKKTEGNLFSKGKQKLSKGKGTVTAIGKRGKTPIGRRGKK